jgi:hypothetical protein
LSLLLTYVDCPNGVPAGPSRITFHNMGNILTGIRVAARLKSANWQHVDNEELFQCLDWSIDEAYGHITPDEILEQAVRLSGKTKDKSKSKAEPKEKVKKAPTISQRDEKSESEKIGESPSKKEKKKPRAVSQTKDDNLSMLPKKPSLDSPPGVYFKEFADTVKETLHNMEKKYEEKHNELEREVKTNEAKRTAANERLSGRLSTLERKLGIGYQIPEDLHELVYSAPAVTSSSDSESEEHKEQTKKVQETLIPSPKNKRKRTEIQSKGVHGQSPSKKQHKDPLQ